MAVNKPKYRTEQVSMQIKIMLEEHLGVDAEEVIDDADIEHDLGADSLDTVEIVMSLEEEFAIEIPDEDVEAIPGRKVKDIIRYVTQRLGAAGRIIHGATTENQSDNA